MPNREEMECHKLDSEINQLALQKRKLSRELSIWQMPSAWEIVKSVGIFLPLLFTSLGYCRSLEQDRQAQLKEATEVFLENTLGAGPHLLEVYVDKYCGDHGSLDDDDQECRQAVARILVLGLRIRDEEITLARSEGAMQTLKALEPNDQVVEQLCRRVSEDVIFIQERYVQPAVARRTEGLDEAGKKVIDEAQSALRRMKPVVCTAVELGLCPEERLKALSAGAWEGFQSYLRDHLKPECKT